MKPAAIITILNEMRGTVFDCSPSDIADGSCVYRTGEEVLETFKLSGGTGKYLGIMLAVTLIWRVIAWGLLRLRVASL
jgi:hypothetical protein